MTIDVCRQLTYKINFHWKRSAKGRGKNSFRPFGDFGEIESFDKYCLNELGK
jgi:hypothetical protein